MPPSSKFLPSIQQDHVGDKFEGIVLRRRIVDYISNGENTRALVLDLMLDSPRTQGEVTGTEWAWWLQPGSHATAQLKRAILKSLGEYRAGLPAEGDRVWCELTGSRPTAKLPKKLFLVGYSSRSSEMHSDEQF